MKTFIALAAATFVAACAVPPAVVSLKYDPPSQVNPVWKSLRPVKLGAVADQRGTPSRWVGRLAGGYANKAMEVEADAPAVDLVRAAFASALAARAQTDEASAWVLSVNILKLEGDKVIRREATTELQVALHDERGLPRFAKTYTSNIVAGSMWEPTKGQEALIDELRETLRASLQQATDRAFDDPALQAALLRQ